MYTRHSSIEWEIKKVANFWVYVVFFISLCYAHGTHMYIYKSGSLTLPLTGARWFSPLCPDAYSTETPIIL
jgi:hypothetical protein